MLNYMISTDSVHNMCTDVLRAAVTLKTQQNIGGNRFKGISQNARAYYI